MIYLDSAATTLQKPEAVRRAMARAAGTMSSPGRGSYPASHLAEETAYRCRSEAAELFDVPSPEQVVFTFNATHGLNIAIKTLVRPGSRVVISGYEHNAVTRPLHGISNVEILVADAPLFHPEKTLSGFAEALALGADVAICSHVSNVFGCVQPVEQIARLCRSHGVPLIVDASQSAGVLPVELKQWDAAFVAMPGHKGLYGPQGTGLLLCNHQAISLLEGGTGSASLQQEMPDFLPDQLEAGTHNMPGIAGLLEGLRFVRRTGLYTIAGHEKNMAAYAARRLEKLPGVNVFADKEFQNQTGVLSFTVNGRDCEEIGEALAQNGIAVRSGLQCAPLAHRTAGTLETGTVRVSPSAFTTKGQVDHFAVVLERMIRENVGF
ncbi:MAG: aminotransferase class V-fold PLP-dependent enzyme [Clostridiales bacterium]|nr:aminotransferase class V-fold PLP-dependent enzyme [Candidatus Cacconaster stercorequi]